MGNLNPITRSTISNGGLYVENYIYISLSNNSLFDGKDLRSLLKAGVNFDFKMNEFSTPIVVDSNIIFTPIDSNEKLQQMVDYIKVAQLLEL